MRLKYIHHSQFGHMETTSYCMFVLCSENSKSQAEDKDTSIKPPQAKEYEPQIQSQADSPFQWSVTQASSSLVKLVPKRLP
jgi:hypothetical protein